VGGRIPYDPSASRDANARLTLTLGGMRNAIRALNAADVAVYRWMPGLTTDPHAMNNIATMKDLARGTGGRAYFHRNDLMNSIREAVQDSAGSYTFAYYPEAVQTLTPFQEDHGEIEAVRSPGAAQARLLRHQ